VLPVTYRAWIEAKVGSTYLETNESSKVGSGCGTPEGATATATVGRLVVLLLESQRSRAVLQLAHR
jgi:hypothetical protein